VRSVSETVVHNFFYAESANKTLPNRLMMSGNKAAVGYLRIAKNIEKAYQPAIYSWEEGSKDSLALVESFEKVQQMARSTSELFLKERYAFQAVKLAMILGQPETCVKLYDELVKPLKTKTFISDWAFARKAGATMALGDTAKAIYEFAQVFEHSPSRRREADLSLRIKGIRFQEKALDYCQNDAEKAAVYALCAIQPFQDALPMLKKIIELNPKNATIELIAAREINRNEYYALDPMPYVEDTLVYTQRRDESKRYFDELADFMAECATNKKLSNPAFWFTASSYTQYVSKDYDKASEYLTKAQSESTENVVLKQQMEVQQMLLLIAKQDKITPEFENQAITMLEKLRLVDNFRTTNAYTRACGLLAKMYRGQPLDAEKSGGWLSGCSSKKNDNTNYVNVAKAFLIESAASWQSRGTDADGYATIYGSNTDRYLLEDSTSAAHIAQTIQYLQQPNLSDVDKKFVALSGLNQTYLQILLGRKHLAGHNYNEAYNAFSKVPAGTWKSMPFADYLVGNPFYISPDNGQQPSQVFTPMTFAQRMAELEKRAKNGDAEAAYLMGCGAYNMGYYGNSWLLSRRAWSGAEFYTYPPKDFSKEDYYTAIKAREYFEKAVKLSKNSELSAKATFGIALCEANAFSVFEFAESSNRDYQNETEEAYLARIKAERSKRFNTAFQQLNSQYPTAAYTEEVLAECATYRDFAGK